MKAIRTYKKLLIMDFHIIYTTPPHARFEVLTVTLLNIKVFWVVMPCSLCGHVCNNLRYMVHSYTAREVQHKYMVPSQSFLYNES